MSSKITLRIASVISFVFAGGHVLGGRQFWSPIGESTVLAAMRTFTFDAQDVSRTYLDFYFGFGLTLWAYLIGGAPLLQSIAPKR